MIETKHLEEFIGDLVEIISSLRNKLRLSSTASVFYGEYKEEIIKRLRAYDKIKKEVAEEFIDKKAREAMNMEYGVEGCGVYDWKDFLRSFAKEIQGK